MNGERQSEPILDNNNMDSRKSSKFQRKVKMLKSSFTELVILDLTKKL